MPRTLNLKLAFRHPIWWSALTLLLINDQLLKGAGVLPGVVTGKLSDFAGLIVAPVVLAWLFRVKTRRGFFISFVLTSFFFSAIQLSPSLSNAFVSVGHSFGLPWANWADPTDLIALFAPLLAFGPLVRASEREAIHATHGGAMRFVAVVGALSCLASIQQQERSAPPDGTFRDMGTCGDGVVDFELGEGCDDGNDQAGDGCTFCQEDYCGDGYLGEDEDCDDGDIESGDGCTAYCELEASTCVDGGVSYWLCETAGVSCESVFCTEENPDPRCPEVFEVDIELLLTMDGRTTSESSLSLIRSGEQVCEASAQGARCDFTVGTCADLVAEGDSSWGGWLTQPLDGDAQTWMDQRLAITEPYSRVVALFERAETGVAREETTGYARFAHVRGRPQVGLAFSAYQRPEDEEVGVVGRYDNQGALLWRFPFADTTGWDLSLLALPEDGGVVVGGPFQGSLSIAGTDIESQDEAQLLFLKFSESGELLWHVLIALNGAESIRILRGDSSGGAILVEQTQDETDRAILLTRVNETTEASLEVMSGPTLELYDFFVGEEGQVSILYSSTEEGEDAPSLKKVDVDSEGMLGEALSYSLSVLPTPGSMDLVLSDALYFIGEVEEGAGTSVGALEVETGSLLWSTSLDPTVFWMGIGERGDALFVRGVQQRGGPSWTTPSEALSLDVAAAWVVDSFQKDGSWSWRESQGGLTSAAYPIHFSSHVDAGEILSVNSLEEGGTPSARLVLFSQ